MRFIMFFSLLVSFSANVWAVDVNLENAKEWLLSSQNEMTRARKLMRTNPTDSEIGEESRRVRSVSDGGVDLFPAHRDWFDCRGVAANMWPLWWYGYRGKYMRSSTASADLKQFDADYKKSLLGCKAVLKR
ncbi:hypothetical protein [Methylotenera sp.]|uniref:hypothetical protein n=3 Tax=Methylotenera sp. TaxID=2051956 RepID=UPI00272ADC13|nr:hypothetical protein [Methylotenera sp.]MDZ4213100.1 hypothetical protein [Methylotenera sp.]